MLGIVFIVAGVSIMLFGVIMLWQWTGAARRWFNAESYDQPGETKNQRQYIDLFFLATVAAPLLFGGMLIVFGLRRLL